MKLNYYAIASFPEMTWDSELPTTTADFLDNLSVLFEPFKEGIDKILLLNDIKNVELLLRTKVDISEDIRGNRGDKIDFFRAKILSIDELELFLQNHYMYGDSYPSFIHDFFEINQTNEDRFKNIEDLYLMYFRYLRSDKEGFFRYYGTTELIIRTVYSALRLIRAGKELEPYLKGDDDIVKTILEHRSSTDLGLKNIFPEVQDIISIFDKNPMDLEHQMDKIRFTLMDNIGKESPFGDYMIYAYIVGFQLKNRWNTLDLKLGNEILKKVIEG